MLTEGHLEFSLNTIIARTIEPYSLFVSLWSIRKLSPSKNPVVSAKDEGPEYDGGKAAEGTGISPNGTLLSSEKSDCWPL